MVPKRWGWILFGSLTAVAVLWLLSYRGHAGALVDDAYISFRYAQRLASGLGFTWNDGLRVEGFSNPLWVVVLAGIARLGLAPHGAAPALGAICGLLTVLGGWSLARTRRLPYPAAGLLPMGLALDVGLAVWGGSGLETSAAALTAIAVLLIAAGLGPDSGVARGAGLGLGVAAFALLRPEGVLLAVLTGGWLVWGSWARFRVLVGFAVGLLPFLGYLVFRLVYFGRWVPNTFFAKVEPGTRGLIPALTGLGEWALAHAVFVGLGLSIFFATNFFATRQTGPTHPRGPRAFLWLAVGWLAIEFTFVVLAGGDWMGHSRYLVAALPAFYLLVAESARRLRPEPLATVVVLVALMLHPAVGWVTRDEIPRYTLQGRELGLWLRSVAEPGETLAVTAAGAIPYFSRLPTLDVLGLNDPAVGGRVPRRTSGWAPGHNRYDLDRLMEALPTWIVWDFSVKVNRHRLRELAGSTVDEESLDYRRALLRREDFRDRYTIEYAAPPATQLAYTVYRRR